MKFSWQLINSFIKIEENKFKEIENKLVLSGIEIDNTKKSNHDKILDLSITANRKEINSAFGLAREISIITNINMKVIPIKLKLTKDTIDKLIHNENTNLNYIRIHITYEKIEIKTPQWILSQLRINKTKEGSTLENIQKYIQIKWGQTFNIVKTTSSKELILGDKIKSYSKLINSLIDKNKGNDHRLQLIIFTVEQQNIQKNSRSYSNDEFYENYYIDSLKIINTIYKNTLGKYQENYKVFKLTKKHVSLKQSTINQWLGSITSDKIKFLEITNTTKILKRLQLSPRYIRAKKLFTLQIPEHRSHDLKRDIDIVEEIGRIYEFKNFYSACENNKNKGSKSITSINVNHIRATLRNLGLNEVINFSLTINKSHKTNILGIHNPVSKEQKELRKNVAEGLIKNYEHHIKYSNKNLLIFEIGKIFKKDRNANYFLERKHLGGLIYTTEYGRRNWLEKPKKIQLLQAKGIIKLFMEKINAKVKLKYISNTVKEHSISHLLIKGSQIGILDTKSSKIMGVIGELSQQSLDRNQKKFGNVYLFEINLSSLLNSIKLKTHLDYSRKRYSDYPSVIRDISLIIKKNKHIQEIREKINKINHKFIESIKIFNEYTKNRPSEERSIGIRITYRSFKKTLTVKDLKNINNEIDKVINSLN
uniref:phenylalanine--tRNA ligase n=1 Tax=Vertebrata lanosa TaxID=1261582 RepID=A0A0B5VV42_9FLOR|nr:phenylalanine--tRNA ligase beta subunit [Vertebrata lanosa]AJH66068.1 phenylalanine--tRNA ligase beta subunit [Vertebrata lanosa]